MDQKPDLNQDDRPLGVSGGIAKRFLTTEITPLLALVALLMGLFAVLVTPREEEPQIDVTFANVFIPFPGATAKEVETLVSSRAEQIFAEIEGVEHIYSASRPGMSVLTVQFKVGQPRTEAIVRLYNAMYSNQDWLPANLGVGQALIKPKGIDDVPIVSLTLWSEDDAIAGNELLRIAHSLETELQRVPGTRDIETLGGPDRVVHVLLDPQRLAGYGLDTNDLSSALAASNDSRDAGSYSADNREILVQAGDFMTRPEEVADMVVGMRNGAPVYLRDVADVRVGADDPKQYVRMGVTAVGATSGLGPAGQYPAVTVAISKKPGTNAVKVADQVMQRVQALEGVAIPAGVHVTETRNYGQTANDKAQTLIKKLIFATASVVLLVWLTLGRRESFVVGAAVVVTLAATLFASWAWGFTLNRVSLFALIFSIGILVDDAIVVVENIHRHMQLGGKSLTEAIPPAVDEVGGPTILATFTVIAALLPMAFVSGLMGPYMAPIPINASMGMVISLAVAFVFTPWLYRRVFLKLSHADAHGHAEAEENDGRLMQLFRRAMTPFLNGAQGRGKRVALLASILLLISASMGLAAVKLVVLKMLPLDNKSEFQVVVDMPEGTTLEQTQAVLDALGVELDRVPEVLHWQSYAGAASPINFNGLVRQYYLRSEPYQGDLQVTLLDKHERSRKSHEIALAVRGPLQKIGQAMGANVKIVEVPPGPPVLSPIVAEIYGLDHARQADVARQVRAVFESTPDIVDIDDTLEAPQQKWIVVVDRSRAAQLGVAQTTVADALAAVLGGADVSYLHDDNSRYPVPVRLEFTPGDKADLNALKSLRVRSSSGSLVPISEVARFVPSTRETTIYHKDLLPMVMVTGDLAGALDSPLYGMADIASRLSETPIDGRRIDTYLTQQPELPVNWSLKWDGEWQITYETFRDMGAAYAVGLVLIYLLVVAQFRSYSIPLIIMAPIPLTMIGIMPGHALLGKQFTATSMIGMIALAGIIVRNSILLVDFIQQEVAQGRSLQDAVIRAGAIRARPIALTGLAAMLGAMFILDDPIFSGLAVSLIFGIFVSTILTLFVIPVVYYAYRYQAAPETEPG
ncbi:efflux RND transporter permease subunit [Sinimarinibacterium sp. CAU 1509]|uniref:efflux RND transporter permease subunit n=1 Tax=Sinimarinibacterium sp. CAU 1509 TaxID=2562283 RepID=UPI0010AB9255|nr:efflux RND transporter permease subunit [Sinimarinibacterium sp. CAU 1509]TJY60058.1 efflux RND transporter permease subunit [Sinimarinibacterium sp. CAU 1509]